MSRGASVIFVVLVAGLFAAVFVTWNAQHGTQRATRPILSTQTASIPLLGLGIGTPPGWMGEVESVTPLTIGDGESLLMSNASSGEVLRLDVFAQEKELKDEIATALASSDGTVGVSCWPLEPTGAYSRYFDNRKGGVMLTAWAHRGQGYIVIRLMAPGDSTPEDLAQRLAHVVTLAVHGE